MSRTLRAMVTTRRNLNTSVLTRAINGYYPAGQTPKVNLLDYLEEVNIIRLCYYQIFTLCNIGLLVKSNSVQLSA